MLPNSIPGVYKHIRKDAGQQKFFNMIFKEKPLPGLKYKYIY